MGGSWVCVSCPRSMRDFHVRLTYGLSSESEMLWRDGSVMFLTLSWAVEGRLRGDAAMM